MAVFTASGLSILICPDSAFSQFACRTSDASSPRVFFLRIGDVRSFIAPDRFDATRDDVVNAPGDTIHHFYRDHIGLAQFQPDAARTDVHAASGWSTWHSYGWGVTQDTVLDAAALFARTLLPFGFRTIQIDDGWQTAHRIWTHPNDGFSVGMDSIARAIHRLGLQAGIWLIPEYVDEDSVGLRYDAWISDSSGPIKTGNHPKYFVDPTAPGGRRYLHDLATMLAGWGYKYFKIDFQQYADLVYSTWSHAMRRPDSSSAVYYRGVLDAFRLGVGDSSYLVTSAAPYDVASGMSRAAPLSGVGRFDATRVLWDMYPDWKSFNDQLQGLMWYYLFHRYAFLVDLDAIFVGTNVSPTVAQAWATMFGITGLPLIDGDHLGRLSQDRLDLLKRAYPPAAVAPLDLFPTLNRIKKIYDLKVNAGRRAYDVVALFRCNGAAPDDGAFSWGEMGWEQGTVMHGYDYWNKTYLGVFRDSARFDVPDSGCRLLSFTPASAHVSLLSTNRHITQGAEDLADVRLDSATEVFTGVSAVVGGDPYVLSFVIPVSSDPDSAAVTAWADGAPTDVVIRGPLVEVTVRSGSSRQVRWRVQFSGINGVREGHEPAVIMNIFPDPAHKVNGGTISITMPTGIAGGAVTMYNAKGVCVGNSDVHFTSGGVATVVLPPCGSGLYVLSLQTRHGTTARTIRVVE
jgi:hypothetical protein